MNVCRYMHMYMCEQAMRLVGSGLMAIAGKRHARIVLRARICARVPVRVRVRSRVHTLMRVRVRICAARVLQRMYHAPTPPLLRAAA